MRFLVATWGCPWLYSAPSGRYSGFRWEPVRYCLRLEEGVHVYDRNVRCTLPLLYDYVKPDRVLVFVLDTVAERCVSSYEELVDHVKDMYYGFIEEDLGLDRGSIEVVVAPGVGLFSNGLFKGLIGDFYAYAVHRLAYVLGEAKGSDLLEVHLDLTHGINFMPTLAYRAVRELTGIVALTRSVRLVVYNSEPHTRGVRELCVHVVEDHLVVPSPCREGLSNQLRFLERVEVSAEEYGKLCIGLKRRFKELGLDYRELNAFLGSIVNGLPLALYTFYPDVESVERFLDHVLEVFLENIRVGSLNGRPLVERRVGLGRDFTVLSKAMLAAKIIGLSRRVEASLEELERVRDEVFSKDKRLDAMISRDLHNIRVKAGEKKGKLVGWVKLRDLLGLEGKYDFRNFLAHSGLEGNVTEVKVDENIMLRYALESLVERGGKMTSVLKVILEDAAQGLTK